MSALRELLARFDVDTGDAKKKMQDVGASIGELKGAFSEIGKSILTAFSFHKVKEFIEGQIELGSRVNDLSAKLGVGTDELQQFQFAAGLVGVEGESAAQALGFLNKNMGEALSGGAEQAKTFAELGVKLKDTHGDVRELGDVIPDLADAFKGMNSQQERTATAMKLFGKSGAQLLPLLQDGSEGLAKMKEEFELLGGGMQKDFIEKADEAGDEIDKMKFAMTGLKSRIALAVLPTVTEFAKKGQALTIGMIKMTKETNLAKFAWGALGIVMAAAFVKMIIGWTKFLGLIPKGGNIWSSLFKLGEIGLIIAAVIAVALAFEDLWVMINGGDSVIGDVIESLFGVGAKQEVIRDVRDAFDEVRASVVALKPIAEELGHILVEVWPYMRVAIREVGRSMLTIIGGTIKFIAMWIENVTKAIGKLLTVAGRFSNEAGEALGIDTLKDFGKAAAKAGVGLQSATEKRSAVYGAERPVLGDLRQTQTNNIDIKVEGGSTNAETGRAVAGAVRGALYQNDMNDALAAVSSGAGED